MIDLTTLSPSQLATQIGTQLQSASVDDRRKALMAVLNHVLDTTLSVDDRLAYLVIFIRIRNIF